MMSAKQITRTQFKEVLGRHSNHLWKDFVKQKQEDLRKLAETQCRPAELLRLQKTHELRKEVFGDTSLEALARFRYEEFPNKYSRPNPTDKGKLLVTPLTLEDFKKLMHWFMHHYEAVGSPSDEWARQINDYTEEVVFRTSKAAFDLYGIANAKTEKPHAFKKHPHLIHNLIKWCHTVLKFAQRTANENTVVEFENREKDILWKRLVQRNKMKPELRIAYAQLNSEVFANHTLAMDILSGLRGVLGTTQPTKIGHTRVPSLLLSVHDKDNVLFHSYESHLWLCQTRDKNHWQADLSRNAWIQSTMHDTCKYAWLQKHFKDLVTRLGGGISALDVEKVAFVLMTEKRNKDRASSHAPFLST